MTLTDHRFLTVTDYIDTHMIRTLPISELADRACMSESNFYRAFRRQFGMTPVEYMNRQRIAQAQQLLETTSRDLTDISVVCGFTNVSYFVRLFRRVVGIPPGQYRRVTYRVEHVSPRNKQAA